MNLSLLLHLNMVGSAVWKGKFYMYAADVRLDLTMQNVRLDLAIAAKGGSFYPLSFKM